MAAASSSEMLSRFLFDQKGISDHWRVCLPERNELRSCVIFTAHFRPHRRSLHTIWNHLWKEKDQRFFEFLSIHDIDRQKYLLYSCYLYLLM